MTTDEAPELKAATSELHEHLPLDPAQFYGSAEDADLPSGVNPEEAQVLERLGQPPFPKSKFPFVGFLAGVYEHVSQRAASMVAPPSPAETETVPTDTICS
jgi:hypothetical protein